MRKALAALMAGVAATVLASWLIRWGEPLPSMSSEFAFNSGGRVYWVRLFRDVGCRDVLVRTDARWHWKGEAACSLEWPIGFSSEGAVLPVRRPASFVRIPGRLPPEMESSVQSELTRSFGWPCPAMWYGERDAGSQLLGFDHGAWLPRKARSPFREPELPLGIHRRGFAVNTAFYGTLAFLLWSAPGFAKRRFRRRRGRCLACGYELKGLAKCPECGAS